MDDPETVHDINELTVVTDESYTDFVAGLQKEISETLAHRPRKATEEYFVGKKYSMLTGEETIDDVIAKQLCRYLVKHDYLNDDDTVARKFDEDERNGALPTPTHESLAPIFDQLVPIVKALYLDIPQPSDGRKPKRVPLNQANFEKKEFQELWAQINRKAIYQVDFDSNELIAKCVASLDAQLSVNSMKYFVEEGRQREALEADQLSDGKGFEKQQIKTAVEAISAASQVKYDLLGEIAEKTHLTRRTICSVLTEIKPETFAMYKMNPEQFITDSSKLINEQKASVIVEHLTYDTQTGEFDAAIFTDNQSKQDFSKAGSKLEKHIYDYVVTDSKVERSFVSDLDKSDEVVVYAKLPNGFFIPTPLGNYNPDWAIAFRRGAVKHVHFVAETKGSLSSLELRPIEDAKISCARRFFSELAKLEDGDVEYGVVTDYATLMDVVGVTGPEIGRGTAAR